MRRFAIYFVLVAICFTQASAQDAKESIVPQSVMSEKEREKLGRFGRNLPVGFQRPEDDVARRLLREYGAAFVARNGVTVAGTVVFRDEAEVMEFQKTLQTKTEMIAGFSMTLQSPAMSALIDAINEATVSGLTITPRDVDSAARNYDQSVGLWASRVEPALDHWVAKKKIMPEDAERIRSLPLFEQVREVLQLEKRKIYFAKDLNKSIIYSVAPPGTSQHLAMLAFDVREFNDAGVRAILAKHGWYQTVVSDLPHFTYLGAAASELKELGLKKVKHSGRVFWVPDI